MKAVQRHRHATVRGKAGKAIQGKTERLRKLPKEDVERLVHELGVHQVEMEMQNENLRQAQEALDASRRRYAELYEFAPAGYFTFDKHGFILEVNQTGAKLLGSEKQALLKKSFSMFIEGSAGRERFQELHREAVTLGTGKPIDIKLRRKDRTIFDARLQFVFTHEFAAEAACCRAVLIDISERKQLEEALQLSEENYRLLFDESPLPKWVVDLETFAFLEVNNAAVEHYGYSRDEFRRLTLADIRTMEEFERFERALEESRTKGSKFEGRFQTKHRKKNAEIIDVDIRYTDIVYNGRRSLLGVIIDVTERGRAERERERLITELQRSNRELQQFAYIASHDLQEPLRTVSSYVDLLAMKYKGKLDQTADKYISFAVEGAHRMSELINDLLAFSRVGTQGRPFARVNLEEVLERVLGNLRKSEKESAAAITRDAMPHVTGDQSQLSQVFQNLISNAIKFGRKDVQPRIHISAERKGNEWVFGMHDNGIGIEPRFYERIFTIFQRLHTRSEYPGTGVGLAICKRIVERHGGHIWVESKPGEGSTFYFTLPVRE